jgi:putative sterol carrier protein
MLERARPPADITPEDFFTRWVPDSVGADEDRRRKLTGVDAAIVFELAGEGGGDFTIHIVGGRVDGLVGGRDKADLRVCVDIATWRELNSGEISAPEALLRRRVKLEGDFLLGLKLHLILG